MAQAESGMMSINGDADGDPLRVGYPVADVAASQAVVQAVLAALFRRERTGVGGTAHVSLVAAAIHAQSALWGEWAASGVEPRRKGNGQATAAPAADLVTTTDGQVMVSAYTTEHFDRLCRLIDKAWRLDDPRFADNALVIRNANAAAASPRVPVTHMSSPARASSRRRGSVTRHRRSSGRCSCGSRRRGGPPRS